MCKNLAVTLTNCVQQMRLIILFLPLTAVIALSGASILDAFDQRKVKTVKKCIEKGTPLDNVMQISVDDIILKCEISPPDYEKYIEVDSVTGQRTCKDTAPWKCRNSVQVYGLIWAYAWGKVPDPTICDQYEEINTVVKSCKL